MLPRRPRRRLLPRRPRRRLLPRSGRRVKPPRACLQSEISPLRTRASEASLASLRPASGWPGLQVGLGRMFTCRRSFLSSANSKGSDHDCSYTGDGAHDGDSPVETVRGFKFEFRRHNDLGRNSRPQRARLVFAVRGRNACLCSLLSIEVDPETCLCFNRPAQVEP